MRRRLYSRRKAKEYDIFSETNEELKKYRAYIHKVCSYELDIPYDLMQDMQNFNSVQPRIEIDMCEIF